MLGDASETVSGHAELGERAGRTERRAEIGQRAGRIVGVERATQRGHRGRCGGRVVCEPRSCAAGRERRGPRAGDRSFDVLLPQLSTSLRSSSIAGCGHLTNRMLASCEQWDSAGVAFYDDVRRRPGMYFGDPHDGTGALQMALEIVSNSIDQHLVERCSRIDVQLDDGAVTVTDDGSGIPTPARWFEQLFTTPTVDGHRPHMHVGLRGVGLGGVNALAEELAIDTVRDGRRFRAVYSRGEIEEPWRDEPTSAPSGTTIRMRPDRSIFTVGIPAHALDARLVELAYVLPRLAFGRGNDGEGLVGLVAKHAGCERGEVAHTTAHEPIDIEVALAWHDGPTRIDSFANFMPSREHGRHVDGLLSAVRAAGKEAGLVAAVHVVLEDVRWGSPTTDRLVSDEVRAPVARVTRRALARR